MKKPSEKTIGIIYDSAKMACFLCAFAAVFVGGAFYQVFYWYPQENYTWEQDANYIYKDNRTGELTTAYELPEDGVLKVKYLKMVKNFGIGLQQIIYTVLQLVILMMTGR